MSNAAERANLPGIGLIVVGVLFLLYYGISVAFGLLGLLFGGMAALVSLFASLEDSGALFSALLQSWGVIVGLVQTIVYAIELPIAALIILGGVKAMGGTGLSAAKRGAMLAIAGPIIGLLTGLLALLSLDICGTICGLIPDVVMTVLGIGAGGFAWTTLADEEVAAAFEANEG